MKNGPTRTAIKAACETGPINHETMVAALDDSARALAWTAHKLDGNAGPASPPEGWQEEVTEVTAGTLTHEQIKEVEQTAVGALYLDCLDATTGGRWIEARGQRLEARARIAAAINARRSKEATNA